MIKFDNKTIVSVYSGTKTIEKIYKGTLKVYEGWRNLIANGVPPLTLTKCKGVDLVNYKIEGNSVQDGTPTPDTPIEVESVGDKTLNICEELNFFHTFGSSYEWYKNGFKATTTKDGGYSNYVGITLLKDGAFEWGGTYTISCHIEQTHTNMYTLMRVGYFRKDTNSWKDFTSVSVKSGQINKITFTLPSEAPSDFGTGGFYSSDDIQMFFNIQISEIGEFGSITVTDVMVVEGSETKPYEQTGYRIPVKVKGKNLFGDLLKNKWVDTSGNIIDMNSPEITQNIPCKNGDVFTISAEFPSRRGNNSLVLNFRDINGNSLARYTETTEKNITLTKEAPTGTAYLVAGHYITKPNWIQLEKNNNITEYEPYVEPITTNIYLNEPLRKIGEYADYIDFVNKKVIRKIYKSMPYSKNWNSGSSYSNGLCRYQCQLTPIPNYNVAPISNGIKGNVGNIISEANNITFNPTYNYLYMYFNCSDVGIEVPDATTTNTENGTAIKNYIDEKGIYILYVLEQKIEEKTIELPNIPTHKGTTIIEVDTTIQPSNMEVVYKGK